MTGHFVDMHKVEVAATRISDLVKHTPLIRMPNYSEQFGAEIYFKREDLQRVRSYKIRGAFNKIRSLVEEKGVKQVVCASAGNHAQGVAQVCHFLKIKGLIFMPVTTPAQKIQQVRMFGRDYVEIQLVGDTFDASNAEALKYSQKQRIDFVHPFDDQQIIEGQGTVALEILHDLKGPLDVLFVPVGGGGLISGIISVLKVKSPSTKVIAVEPEGAPSLKMSLEKGENTALEKIEKFVDGAAVKRIGDLAFSICRKNVDDVILVPEGKICSTMLKLYNEKAIVVEPAGALSVAALDLCRKEISGKRVACVVSGGNNDISRMEEIKERSLLYEGLKHYFLVTFPQRAGALKEFVVNVLGETDDITYFEYAKKNSRARSSAVVGIELKNKKDFEPMLARMKTLGFYGEYLNNSPQLFQFLI